MLSRLRSYAEHRYSDHQDHRTAIVENSPLFGLLFLHNNLHVLHHQRPAVPWYRIPALYRRYRDNLIKLNNGRLQRVWGSRHALPVEETRRSSPSDARLVLETSAQGRRR